MKTNKQEIIERWRNLGFLQGIKEGGVIEWRCAKSFEDMAQYITALNEGEEEEFCLKYGTNIEVIVFPMLRRCLANKNKITFAVDPENLFNWLDGITMEDLLNYAKEQKMGERLSIFWKQTEAIINFMAEEHIQYDGVEVKDMRAVKFMSICESHIKEVKTYDNDCDKIIESYTIIAGAGIYVVDVGAEILAMLCRLICERYHNWKENNKIITI